MKICAARCFCHHAGNIAAQYFLHNRIWKRIEVVITSRTRNAVVRKGTWVRIPPLPPKSPVAKRFSGLFFFLRFRKNGLNFRNP